MDTIYRWIAYSLPQRLVYWAAIRVWAYSGWSDGIKVSFYGDLNIRCTTALNKWKKGHEK